MSASPLREEEKESLVKPAPPANSPPRNESGRDPTTKKWNFEFSSNIGKDGDLEKSNEDHLSPTTTPPLKTSQSLLSGDSVAVGFAGPRQMQQDAVYVGEPAPKPRSRSTAFNYSLYSSKKSAAQGLLDLALLMANASQLKLVLMTNGDHRFYYIILSLLCISIGIQVVVGLMLLWLARMQLDDPAVLMQAEKDQADMMLAAQLSNRPDIMAAEATDGGVRKYFKKSEYPHTNVIRKHRRIDYLNNLCIAGIFVLTIVNVFISAFGLHEAKPLDRGLKTA